MNRQVRFKPVSFRFNEQEVRLLDHLAERLGRNRSDTVRTIIKLAAADDRLDITTAPPVVHIVETTNGQ